jgi:hypothetical protein
MTKHMISIAALETVDHAELTLVEGGVVLGPGCPGYPGGDEPIFQPFGLPDFGRPIIVC